MGMSARVPCMDGVPTSSQLLSHVSAPSNCGCLQSGEKDFMFFDNVEEYKAIFISYRSPKSDQSICSTI